MKKILINENKEKFLFQKLINEEINGYSDKILLIKKYLDNNYIKSNYNALSDDGDIVKKNIVILLDKNKQPTELHLTLQQLFDKLQYKFKSVIYDKDERDNLLKQIIIDWFNNKISKYGNLSKY